jgi:PAS domain S-box-containing protein
LWSEWSSGAIWPATVGVLVVSAGLALSLLPRLATFRTLVPRWRSAALVVVALVCVGLGLAAIRTGHVASGTLVLSVAVGAALGALHLVIHCYRRAEDENERERRRSDSLFQGAPEAIVLVGLDRRLRRVNQSFTRLFGWTEDEVRGQLIDELVAPPDKLNEALDISRTVNAGGRVDLQTVRRRKDGSLVPVAVLVAPIWVRD